MSLPSGEEWALRDLLIEHIRADGPMTISEYMSACLTHPQHGYYPRRDPFGRRGDFITAPDISQMFGEMLGLWALACWREMAFAGAPRLVELGAGRGTMMADAVRAIAKVAGGIDAIVIDIVEISPLLRERQQQSLASLPVNPRWHEAFDDVPAGPFVLLANEFLDCLPVRQWQRRAGQWYERLVGVDREGQLAMGQAPVPVSVLPLDVGHLDMQDGMIIEHSQAAHRLIEKVAARTLTGPGVALFIDYGSLRSGFGDTLQAVSAHRFVDPLAEPGLADLTVHVDFDALGATARRAGASIGGPVTQGTFLSALGITERAARLAAGKPAAMAQEIFSQLDRLIAPAQMGDLFKVMGISAGAVALPPFAGSGDG